MKEKLSYGASKFKNRVGWAVINLKNKGFLTKEGKEHRITEIGIRAVDAGETRFTAKFVKSLKKISDNSADDSDDTPKSSGGGSPQVQTVAPDQAVVTVEECSDDAASENETADAEYGQPIDLSQYAGLDPEIEFMLAVRAKIGDKVAFKKLWEKYRSMMIGMFRFCKNLSIDERASESALVFVQKLELFRPEKIGKAPEAWTFSYMLTGGVKNARDKIIGHSKKNTKRFVYGFREGMRDEDDPDDAAISVSPVVLDLNQYDYKEKYNPEIHAMREADGSLEEKEKELMSKLSPLQISILNLRRTGKTVKQIADEMGCGFTMIRLNIVRARKLASMIFDVKYC
jgi:DNA-directed RNA polymerase specialized sigma24 family protein